MSVRFSLRASATVRVVSGASASVRLVSNASASVRLVSGACMYFERFSIYSCSYASIHVSQANPAGSGWMQVL